MALIAFQKLPPDLKRQWLAWLRDPVNRQTRETLVNYGAYCCLGGLGQCLGIADSAMMGHEILVPAIETTSHMAILQHVSDEVRAVLRQKVPGEVFVLLMPTKAENVSAPLQTLLAMMNDTLHWSFGEIADWIEVWL